MVQHTTTPPDQEGEEPSTAPAASSVAHKPQDPAPASPERKPVERLVQPQPHEPADRTETYLRGPTAYCA